jgi:mono/diheme cytochrome c family protein
MIRCRASVEASRLRSVGICALPNRRGHFRDGASAHAGKSESELETDVKGIVGGTIKHPKKITLSAADIANVATYISNNDSK